MQTYDEYYKNYLNSLVLGAKVYPCYDGKGGRATVCEVIRKSGNTVTVKGYFWAEEAIEVIVDFIDGKAWVKYSEEPTVMELLGVTDDDEEGDYYSLIPPDLLKENYTQNYLDCLGLTK